MASKLRDILGALSNGLETIAQYRGGKEAAEADRAFSRETRSANEAFAARMAAADQKFRSGEAALERTSRENLADKAEQSASSRFMAQMAQGREQINLAKEQFGFQKDEAKMSAEDRGVMRQVNAFESIMDAASSRASEVQKTLEKSRAEELKTAITEESKAKINQSYDERISKAVAPEMEQFAVARRKILVLTGAEDESTGPDTRGGPRFLNRGGGQKPASSDSASSPSAESLIQGGGQGANITAQPDSPRVLEAVSAARKQLQGKPRPDERTLAQNFIRGGLSRTEAIAAARMVIGGTPDERRQSELDAFNDATDRGGRG